MRPRQLPDLSDLALDEEEVGGALERAVKYAKAAGDFTENAAKLLPPLTALASWLGPVGHGLLSMLGLSL